MADSTSAQVPARGWRSVMLAGIVGFAFSVAAFHFVLPVRLWESSAPEFAVSLFLSAVVASLTAVLVTGLLSRSLCWAMETEMISGPCGLDSFSTIAGFLSPWRWFLAWRAGGIFGTGADSVAAGEESCQ